MGLNSGDQRNLHDFLIIKRLAYGFLMLSLINTVANLFISDLNLYRVTKLSSRIRKNPVFYKEKFVREYLLMFRKGEKVVPLPRELWYK